MKIQSILFLYSVFIVSGLIGSAQADEYKVSYSTLYKQLKINQQEKYQAIELGVFLSGLSKQEPCIINKAWLANEKRQEQLAVGKDNRLLLPIDGHLKKANPLVHLDLNNWRHCQWSYQMLAKPIEAKTVSYQRLKLIEGQMSEMLDELMGYFGRLEKPSKIDGLILAFPDDKRGEILLTLENNQTESLFGSSVIINSHKKYRTITTSSQVMIKPHIVSVN